MKNSHLKIKIIFLLSFGLIPITTLIACKNNSEKEISEISDDNKIIIEIKEKINKRFQENNWLEIISFQEIENKFDEASFKDLKKELEEYTASLEAQNEQNNEIDITKSKIYNSLLKMINIKEKFLNDLNVQLKNDIPQLENIDSEIITISESTTLKLEKSNKEIIEDVIKRFKEILEEKNKLIVSAPTNEPPLVYVTKLNLKLDIKISNKKSFDHDMSKYFYITNLKNEITGKTDISSLGEDFSNEDICAYVIPGKKIEGFQLVEALGRFQGRVNSLIWTALSNTEKIKIEANAEKISSKTVVEITINANDTSTFKGIARFKVNFCPKINIANIDTSYIMKNKALTLEKPDEKVVKRYLLSLPNLESDFKNILNDENAIINFGKKNHTPNGDITQIEQNLTIKIPENADSKYYNELKFTIRLNITPISVGQLSAGNRKILLDSKNNISILINKKLYTKEKSELKEVYSNVKDFLIDNEDNYYILKNDNSFLFGKLGNLEQIVKLDKTINVINIDQENNWYLGTADGELHFGKGKEKNRFYKIKDSDSTVNIKKIAFDKNNKFYIIGEVYIPLKGNAIYSVNLKTNESKRIHALVDIEIQKIICTSENKNNRFFITDEGKLYLIHQNDTDTVELSSYFKNTTNVDIDSITLNNGKLYVVFKNGDIYFGDKYNNFKLIAKINKKLSKPLAFDSNNRWYYIADDDSIYVGKSEENSTPKQLTSLEEYKIKDLIIAKDNTFYFIDKNNKVWFVGM